MDHNLTLTIMLKRHNYHVHKYHKKYCNLESVQVEKRNIPSIRIKVKHIICSVTLNGESMKEKAYFLDMAIS